MTERETGRAGKAEGGKPREWVEKLKAAPFIIILQAFIDLRMALLFLLCRIS